MIPRTLSASSLQVAELCLDRWNAEYMNRGQGMSNSAAAVGTSVHFGLEKFVDAVYISATHVGLDRKQLKELLISFYQMGYVSTFGSADLTTPEYKDGFDLSMKWFARTDLSTVASVISVEKKNTIPVPYNHKDGTVHDVPFNYVIDRLDYIGEGVYEVVDYKTIRVPMQPEDLRTKIQARAYALAVQIEHPDAERIKVTFDLLRHERISMWFTREDNVNFWRFLCAETQRIVDTDEKDIRPSLNMECGYCVKKFNCPLMLKNIAAGGIHSLTLDQAAQMIADMKAQVKANDLIISQLEDRVLLHAAQNETLDWETEDGANVVEVSAQRRRQLDTQQAATIMGPELFAQMGTINLGQLDKIIKDPSVEQEVRDRLAKLVSYTTGNLSVKVKPKKKMI